MTHPTPDPRALIAAHPARRPAPCLSAGYPRFERLEELPPRDSTAPGRPGAPAAIVFAVVLLCLTLAPVALWVLPKVTP